MNVIVAIFLGIVQGITEFLPVSSSGHLVIFKSLLNAQSDDSVLFETLVHFGTLCAVIAIYWPDVMKLVRFCIQPARWRATSSSPDDKNTAKLLLLIILASVPTALLGFYFHDLFKSLFLNPVAAGIALLLTGIILLCTLLARPAINEYSHISWFKGLLIGIMQGLSITPGISRSGSTIAVGMYLGIDRTTAANLSFLMAVPAIGGAMLYEGKELFKGQTDLGFTSAAGGFIASFISGYIALRFLLSIVRKGKLHYFSYYCFALGLFAILTFGILR